MELKEGQLIAIIRDVAADDAAFIAKALLDSGIDYVEVSLSRPKEGLACIRRLRADFGAELNLGAGTVISEAALNEAQLAGAAYIITPAFDEDLVKAALKKDLPIFPGVFSPAEVMRALRLGLKQLKLFPAGDLGPSYVASLRGPFPEVEFIGVRGISLDNLTAFWKAGCRRFAVGSDLVPRGAAAKDSAAVQERARAYLAAMDRLLAGKAS